MYLVDKDGNIVLDEKSGKPIELTGSEHVYNPSQVKKKKDLIKKGDAQELMSYMKELFKKPQFNRGK